MKSVLSIIPGLGRSKKSKKEEEKPKQQHAKNGEKQEERKERHHRHRDAPPAPHKLGELDIQQQIKLLELYSNMDPLIAQSYLKHMVKTPPMDAPPKQQKSVSKAA
jgi:cobalamin-dependent methionine synthase I